MSQHLPVTSNHPLEHSPKSSLNEQYTYFSTPEDLEEAQHLLSQFIRTSSQEPQSRRTTEIVVHGHTSFRGKRKDRVKRESKHSLKTELPTRVRDTSSPASSISSSAKGNRASRPSSSETDSQSFRSARRSSRPRSGPVNYYEKIIFYTSDSNEGDKTDNEASGRSRSHTSLRSTKQRDSRYTLSSLGHQPTHPQSQYRNHTPSSHPGWQSIVRRRELGHSVNSQLRSSIVPDLQLYKSWKGASNDVIVSAWSPDGSRFVAGATVQCDEHNMEYNRGNNLILGDLVTNSLKELPDHWVPRPTSRSSRNMGDSRLFMSVTAVQWFEDLIFSASYDNTVKLWDATSHANTRCVKTLSHSSKVQVMARSNFNPNVLATGTKSIGLWNIDDASYSPLDVVQPYNRKDIELLATSLVWGQIPATKDILLAGMAEGYAEEEGVPCNGLLAMWIAHEASMVPVQPIPNSQNVFDIKWHPSLPIFATANPVGPHNRFPCAKDAKSVVRLYEPLAMRMRSAEFDCPALDINDITFCPWNPNYLTASCTDGITYVWDRRRNDQIVHMLEHDPPLNQMDENLTREQADVGVRLALWGDSMDQFYSGSSDGVLKRWNILQSPEDVLVGDVMSFPEEIMCGAFSEDKSNLLVGDNAGGLHVLSSSPFPYRQEDRRIRFERAVEPDDDNMSDFESGIAAGNLLLSSGQLVRHPVYGAGQGPHYRGPFAAWARPEGTPRAQIAQTPLDPWVQAQQLHGTSVERRSGLDDQSRENIENQIKLAKIRNRRNEVKRKRRDASNFINLVSEEEEAPKPATLGNKKRDKKTKSRAPRPVITRLEPRVIDLTGDDEQESLDIEEDLEEDFWWPDSADINPNIGRGDI